MEATDVCMVGPESQQYLPRIFLYDWSRSGAHHVIACFEVPCGLRIVQPLSCELCTNRPSTNPNPPLDAAPLSAAGIIFMPSSVVETEHAAMPSHPL